MSLGCIGFVEKFFESNSFLYLLIELAVEKALADYNNGKITLLDKYSEIKI